MLKLDHLANFLAVADKLNFRRAAIQVHLSQSALSRSIQALECSVGHTLLIRGSRRVELTPHGEVLRRHAERMLRENARLLEALGNMHGRGEGTIAIGLGPYVAELYGIEAAATLKEDGRLLCRISIGDFRQVTEDVLSRKVDLAICDLAIARENHRLVCRHMDSTQFFAFVRPHHPLLKSAELTPAEVFGYPFVGARVPMRLESIAHTHVHQVDPLTMDTLPTMNAVAPATSLKLVQNSDTVGFAALSMIEPWLRSEQIKLVPIRIPEISLDAGWIHMADIEKTPLMSRYLDAAEALLAEQSEKNRRLELEFGVNA